MRASVVITTKNRKAELRAALASVFRQTEAVDAVVIDDGSADGTEEMVRAEFPAARLVRSHVSRGLVAQRNAGASLARGEYIFSIDDDAYFASPKTVEQTLREFDHPRVGAVAIPYVEPKKSLAVRQRAPSAGKTFVTDAFIGTAHAVRRDLFLRLEGYRDLTHQGEEADFCIRMLDRGYVVRLGGADPIHHMDSPLRDFRRMDFYGSRNSVLFAWHNAPMPFLPAHLAATSFNCIKEGVKLGRPWDVTRGTFDGWRQCAARFGERRAVALPIYLLHRRLKKRGPRTLDEIEALLPPLDEAAGAGMREMA